MTSSSSVMSVFDEYADFLIEEQKVKESIRDRVRDCEKSCRELNSVLQTMHNTHASKGIKQIPQVVSDMEAIFSKKVRPQLVSLIAEIPKENYYRFYSMVSSTLQRLVFMAVMAHYLKTEQVLLKGDVEGEKWLDIKNKGPLELEDYLGGLIQMSNELARFTVNSVTQGDYERPLRIAAFVGDLLAGFRLLNLKNDFLRRKFDSLKYDIKKMEEVVYDLRIRGLVNDEGNRNGEKEGGNDEKEKGANGKGEKEKSKKKGANNDGEQ